MLPAPFSSLMSWPPFTVLIFSLLVEGHMTEVIACLLNNLWFSSDSSLDFLHNYETNYELSIALIPSKNMKWDTFVNQRCKNPNFRYISHSQSRTCHIHADLQLITGAV